MIHVILSDPSSGTLTEGGAELIDAWESRPDTTIWVSLQGEEPDTEAALMTDRFGVHPLAVTDAQRDRHPPKIESFEGNTFLLLKGLDADSDSLDFGTIQLSLFIGARFLVTRSSERSVSVERIRAAWLDGAIPPAIATPALALRLCRVVADRFVPLLLTVEKRLEELEEEMLGDPTDDLLAELVRQKGDLKQVLRVVQYHTQVFASANNQRPPELKGFKHELTDLHEQLDRQLSLTRLYYELTDDLMSGYLSLSAHRLNRIMQTLTIVTVIFVPITFMAGIYGMNFEYMPELGVRGAYFVLLGVMLLVVCGILTVFYRSGWLGIRRRSRRR